MRLWTYEESMILSYSERDQPVFYYVDDGVRHYSSYKPLIKANINGKIRSDIFFDLVSLIANLVRAKNRNLTVRIATKMTCIVQSANLVTAYERNQNILNLSPFFEASSSDIPVF